MMNKTKCKMDKPFELQHVVLYAKGWYDMSGDLYKDLSLMLELDGRPGYENDRQGIFLIILNRWEKWAEWCNSNGGERIRTLENLIHNDCRMIYRKYSEKYASQNLNDFYDVIIMSILCDWSGCSKEFLNVNPPTYTPECLPKKTGLLGNRIDWYVEAEKNNIKSREGLAEFFNNKIKRLWRG